MLTSTREVKWGGRNLRIHFSQSRLKSLRYGCDPFLRHQYTTQSSTALSTPVTNPTEVPPPSNLLSRMLSSSATFGR